MSTQSVTNGQGSASMSEQTKVSLLHLAAQETPQGSRTTGQIEERYKLFLKLMAEG